MTQGVRPATGLVDARLVHVVLHDRGNGHAGERSVRSLGAKKNLAIRRPWIAVAEPLDDRFRDRIKERNNDFLAAFLGAEADLRLLPIDVVEQQPTGGDRANAISHQQEDDRVVTHSVGRLLVDRCQHPLDGRILDPTGQRGVAILPLARDQSRKVRLGVAVNGAVTEETTKTRRQGTNVVLAGLHVAHELRLHMLGTECLEAGPLHVVLQ